MSKDYLNRREFLKTSAAIVAGVTYAERVIREGKQSRENQESLELPKASSIEYNDRRSEIISQHRQQVLLNRGTGRLA